MPDILMDAAKRMRRAENQALITATPESKKAFEQFKGDKEIGANYATYSKALEAIEDFEKKLARKYDGRLVPYNDDFIDSSLRDAEEWRYTTVINLNNKRMAVPSTRSEFHEMDGLSSDYDAARRGMQRVRDKLLLELVPGKDAASGRLRKAMWEEYSALQQAKQSPVPELPGTNPAPGLPVAPMPRLVSSGR